MSETDKMTRALADQLEQWVNDMRAGRLVCVSAKTFSKRPDPLDYTHSKPPRLTVSGDWPAMGFEFQLDGVVHTDISRLIQG